MRITDMLNEIRSKANKYFRHCEIKQYEKGEQRYWVDIITDDSYLGTLDYFSTEVAGQFNIDKSRFFVWAPKENEIAIGFFLPYIRVLSPSEVEHKFIIVEAEFRDYFPPPKVGFSVLDDGKSYEASLDEYSRIFLTKWFNDHQGVKPKKT